jgi:hypothetical protein
LVLMDMHESTTVNVNSKTQKPNWQNWNSETMLQTTPNIENVVCSSALQEISH